MSYLWDYNSVLGKILLACDDEGLQGLWFEHQKYERRGVSADSVYELRPVLEETVRWLDFYFAGNIPDFTPPLHPHITPFQRSVLQKLMKIPYGCVVTYGDIAREIAADRGVPIMSSRAVGNAVGKNPISLIIPCHRVVGANGSLTGYAGGIEKKRFLLEFEKNHLTA